MVKSYWVVVVVMVAYKILVSAQGPFVLGFWVWGLGVWGLGLTIQPCRLASTLQLSYEFLCSDVFTVKVKI